MTWRFLYLLLFLSFSFPGRTQELVFSNISNEMQLPSQECYNILQDHRGYIWFSTENGLCRYNNKTLTVFDARNGLPEKSVYAMAEDQDGKIWLATSDNRILFFDGTRLKEAAFSKAYQKTSPTWAHPTTYALDVSNPEQFFISNYYYSASIEVKTGKVTASKTPHTQADLAFIKKKDHPLFRLVFKILTSKSTLEISYENKRKEIVLSEFGNDFFSHARILTHSSGNTDLIALHDRLLKINPDLSYSIHKFPERILSLYTDKSGGLWVGTNNNGVFYYPDINTLKLGHHSLRNYSVTGICEDKEKGIWCSTLEKGIFYSKNSQLVSYSSIAGLDRTLTLLKFYNQSLYASSSATDLFRLKQNNLERIAIFQKKQGAFSDLYQQGSSWFFIGKEIMVRTDNQFNSPQRLVQKTYGAVGSYELASNDQGRLISIMYASIFELFEKKQPDLLISTLPFVSKTMLHKNRDTFLLGGNQGLYSFNLKNLTYQKLNGVPDKVIKIIRAKNGRIWILTKENGIFWMDGNKIINANKHFPSFNPSILYDLAEDSSGSIWIGSNQGLYHIKAKEKDYKTTRYTISHGLTSNEVYKVAADNEKIWFSTFEGLFSLPLSVSSFNKTGPEIHLQKLTVNLQTLGVTSRILRFPYNRNNFRFTFDILSFKNGPDTRLEYHLKKEGRSTVTKLNGNEVFLENLDPGKYQLIVYGINNDGIRSPRPEIFLIQIEAPFWMTWWFILLASLVVLFLVFIIVRLIVQGIRKKEEAKTLVNKLMAEYQITALQAQMNPHFIFNAINTIQGYILEKNEDEAYHYLAKFGKLIRTVLHHSQEKTLLLEHELEVLNLYIELEQLRFDHCFDYELNLSDKLIPEDIYLPGMILQPYVENAIWHGIVNLRGSRRGKLEVLMECTDHLLIVTIRDNGIGREMAMGFNKDRRHKSVGMQLTGERLNVMNQLHGYETASVTITDLFDETGTATGTSVEVRIPINIEA